jgi:glycosyltransferase involved in cell wall biosynthesis
MKKKVTYIISNINKALAFEWVATYLNKDKFDLSFILLNSGDTELESFLKNKNILVHRINYRGKRDLPKATIQIILFLLKHKPDVVHTHLFDASLAGLVASRLAGVPKRIQTRHHSSYHHVYFPHMVKYDRLNNFLSTDIIAISNTVRNILIHQDGAGKNKVVLIHHGFDLTKFENVPEEAVVALSLKYNPEKSDPVIGVISRYTKWKGVQFIIPAFAKLLETYPDALLVLMNADGDYKAEIKTLLNNIPKRNYIEIPFENDIFAMYQLFDIFVHTPIDETSEAFGQTYVEVLAAGVPSVFTLSGIANDFIVDQENAIVVPFKSSEAIYLGVMKLLENVTLASALIKRGKKDVAELFQLQKMILALENLYDR